MTRLFDGMGGALADTFGAPVAYFPRDGGPSRLIRSVFRKKPIEMLDEAGRTVLAVNPVWRVPRTEAQGIARGCEIEPQPGQRWRVLNRHPSGSPAADATVTFALERVT